MRKVVSHNFYFAAEMSVGLITVLAIIVFGEKGGALFALYGILALLSQRRKPDEREIQLFHKAGTSTMGSFSLTMLAVYYLLRSINWLMALACSILFFQGLWGLLILRFG